MASSCNRFIAKASLSSFRSSIRSAAPKSPFTARSAVTPPPSFTSKPPSSSSASRFSSTFSRVTSELRCVQSLLPLHSAVSASRMTSCLSTTSWSCRALSQGT